MNVEFLEPAAQEFYEAIVFNDIQRQGWDKSLPKKWKTPSKGSNKTPKPGPLFLYQNGHVDA
jgi:hypothetical protein